MDYNHPFYGYPVTEGKNQPRRNFEDPSPPSFTQGGLGQSSQRSLFNGTQVMDHRILNSATSHTNSAVLFPGANRQPQAPSTAPPPLHARISETHNQHCTLPNTIAPLAPCPNDTTLESVHTHGSHSQGYHGVVLSHNSATTSLHPQQQPQFHGPPHPSFTSGNKAALTTHTNSLIGTPNYDLRLSRTMYAPHPGTSRVPVAPAMTCFPTSITPSPPLAIPPPADALNAANIDERSGHLLPPSPSVRETDAAPPSILLPELEGIDEDSPPPPPPAASCSPLRRQGPRVRKIMDDVPLEPEVHKLQERLRKQGGDEDAIDRVPTVFKHGVSKKALRLRRRKAGGGKSMSLDQGYLNFVGRRQVKKENELGEYYENEWWCRLCPPSERISYVAFKNLQPHLCTKHFGLPGRGKPSGNV